MQKELNPELFSTSTTNSLSIQADHKILEMRAQVMAMADQVGSLISQMNEFIKTSQIKFERLHQSVLKLEQQNQGTQQELNHKYSHLNIKMNERKAMDQKIQEMLDRHNGVLRSYELRMNQLQKLISEKESQLIQTQSALNEAKMDMARLKRL